MCQKLRSFSEGVKELKGGKELSQMPADSAQTKSNIGQTERQKSHIPLLISN